MATIYLEVSQEALDNLKLVVEANTGCKVVDSLALYKSLLEKDVQDSLEGYAYSAVEWIEEEMTVTGLE
jgi:hypothetical protein